MCLRLHVVGQIDVGTPRYAILGHKPHAFVGLTIDDLERRNAWHVVRLEDSTVEHGRNGLALRRVKLKAYWTCPWVVIGQ